jgi:anti-sigma factor RsiW
MNLKKIRTLMLLSGDRKLSAKEEKILSAARKSSPELAAEEELLQKIQQKLAANQPDSFGPWFTERTMNRIRQAAANPKNSFWILDSLRPAYSRVILGAAAMLLIIVAFNLSTTSQPNFADALGITQLPIEEMADPVSQYIWE